MTALEAMQERRRALLREHASCYRCQLKFVLDQRDWEEFSLCPPCRAFILGRRALEVNP